MQKKLLHELSGPLLTGLPGQAPSFVSQSQLESWRAGTHASETNQESTTQILPVQESRTLSLSVGLGYDGLVFANPSIRPDKETSTQSMWDRAGISNRTVAWVQHAAI